MKKFLYLFLIFISCKELVDIDVPNAGQRLVVEASINWEKGTKGNNQFVRLTKSTAYFETKKYYVKGAKVTITNNDTGDVFDFHETKNGIYLAKNFIPKLDNEYILNIDYQGNKYEASEKMVSVVAIDSIKTSEFKFFNGMNKMVEMYYKDPKDIENQYITLFYHNNIPKLRFRTDRVSDGNVNYIGFSDKKLKKGDKIGIGFFGVSKRYYEYMKILSSQAGSNSGSPFQTPPAKIHGNCRNLTNPDEHVLGYFRLSQFVKTSYTVE